MNHLHDNPIRNIPSDAGAIEAENRSHINTDTAAYYLNRKPQTLRVWACYENGPIRPLRINKRLAWPVAQIRSLLATGN